ncbi:trehalose operon repressor [Agrilactobacillus yilanensis]|uniref:Trehalose operon repressor n=1 Tax=Agrilactobacillus yilanensis TaxID=2485997 RepID=A0ABW4J7K2_9LACO|nr:trehalose operon repressor [Agrilactobacillus yilanensis]
MDTMQKYLSIAQDLTNKIKHGQYTEGTLLPSETILANLYGTSRATVRKALVELTENGLIQKIKGKGSVVLDTAKFTFPISGITTFTELNRNQQMNAVTTVLALEDRPLPAEIMKQVGRHLDPAATFIQRLRTVDDEAIVVDEDYLLKSVVPEVPEIVAQGSLYEYMEDTLNLNIAYATKTITVEPMDEAICAKLHLETANLAVVVRSLTYLNDTTFFQYTRSIHRPDRFKFVDFARRKHLVAKKF